MDFLNNITNDLSNDLNNQIKKIIIDGLRLKGFQFDDKIYLSYFIGKYCYVIDDIKNKEKKYYVKDIPFLLYNYDLDIKLNPITENNKITVTANFGTYKFL